MWGSHRVERRRGAHVCYEQPLWPAAPSPRGPRSPQHWGLSRETTGGRGAGPRLLGKHGQAVGPGPWSGDPVHGPQFSRQAAAWHGPWAPAAEWGRDGHSGFMRPGGSPLRLSLVITENLHPTRTHTHTHSQTRAATSSREPSWVGPLDPATPGVTWSTALASGPRDSLGLCREILGAAWVAWDSPGSHGCPQNLSHTHDEALHEGAGQLRMPRSLRDRLVSKSAPCDHLTCRLSGQAAVRSERGERGPRVA